MDPRRWVESVPQMASSPRLSLLLSAAVQPELRNQSSSALRGSLATATPRRHAELLEMFVRTQVAATVRIDVERVGADTALTNLGVDSLVALELRNQLEAGTGLKLSGTLVWSYPTARALAEHLGELLVEAAPPAARAPAPAREVPALSEPELDEASFLSRFDAQLAALEEEV
jgi:acyl carrier protein